MVLDRVIYACLIELCVGSSAALISDVFISQFTDMLALNFRYFHRNLDNLFRTRFAYVYSSEFIFLFAAYVCI